MTAIAPRVEPVAGEYCGVRMSAEEYFQIPDDGAYYELVDGVVIVSPSPTPEHQDTAGEVFQQLREHVVRNKLGRVLFETDVQVGKSPTGGDIVLRPEVIFIHKDRLAQARRRVRIPPDLAVEVVSPYSRRMDRETKYADYERAGVKEYWLFDPEKDGTHFYRLKDGRYVEVFPTGDSFTSEAVPGFVLDLKRVRETFQGW